MIAIRKCSFKKGDVVLPWLPQKSPKKRIQIGTLIVPFYPSYFVEISYSDFFPEVILSIKFFEANDGIMFLSIPH